MGGLHLKIEVQAFRQWVEGLLLGLGVRSGFGCRLGCCAFGLPVGVELAEVRGHITLGGVEGVDLGAIFIDCGGAEVAHRDVKLILSEVAGWLGTAEFMISLRGY
jgi:hypothetical protein